MQRVDPVIAGRRRRTTPALRRRRRQCARVFQWGRLHLERNASCMQPAHDGTMQVSATVGLDAQKSNISHILHSILLRI